jgi:hypothetical protein
MLDLPELRRLEVPVIDLAEKSPSPITNIGPYRRRRSSKSKLPSPNGGPRKRTIPTAIIIIPMKHSQARPPMKVLYAEAGF